MNEIECIERLFNLTITNAGHRQYVYDRELTLECVEGVLARNNGILEWQDPLKPDCGNDDGVWYLVIKMAVTEEDLVTVDEVAGAVYETFFAFDPDGKQFHIV